MDWTSVGFDFLNNVVNVFSGISQRKNPEKQVQEFEILPQSVPAIKLVGSHGGFKIWCEFVNLCDFVNLSG